MANKPWKKSQLIVLARGKAAEHILTVCKTKALTGAASTVANCVKFHWKDASHQCVTAGCATSKTS